MKSSIDAINITVFLHIDNINECHIHYTSCSFGQKDKQEVQIRCLDIQKWFLKAHPNKPNLYQQLLKLVSVVIFKNR